MHLLPPPPARIFILFLFGKILSVISLRKDLNILCFSHSDKYYDGGLVWSVVDTLIIILLYYKISSDRVQTRYKVFPALFSVGKALQAPTLFV